MIAIIAMTVDHVADLITPCVSSLYLTTLLHVIGRLTAPIMFFFICEGFFYTKNLKKYIARMFLFAVVSHFAYCFAFGINYIPFSTGDIFNQTSIMWSLSLGLVGIMIQDLKIKDIWKIVLTIILCILGFPSDWSSIAVMIIIYDYAYRKDFKKQMISQTIFSFIYSLVYAVFINVWYGVIQMGTIFSIPLLIKYNGERGKWKNFKWFFYLIYPLHLVLCGLIRLYLHGNVPVIVGG